MSDLINYKCIACGGTLKFSSDKQKLLCTYCDATYDIAEFEAAGGVESQPEYQNINNTWDLEKEGLVVYACKNCGGEVIGYRDVSSTKCPFCSSPVVISNNFKGNLHPDLIIPFKKTREQAELMLKNYTKLRLRKKRFNLKSFYIIHFKDLVGIYVPYWLYDSVVHADSKYKAVNITTITNTLEKQKEKNIYEIDVSGDITFENVPADASSIFNDKFMDSMEPFDAKEAVPYSSGYLSGYMAYKYNVNPEWLQKRINNRLYQSVRDIIKAQVSGYDTVTERTIEWDTISSSHKYALYPVWILTIIYKGKKYNVAMNGQTGKIVDNLPIEEDNSFPILKEYIFPILLLSIFIEIFFILLFGIHKEITKDFLQFSCGWSFFIALFIRIYVFIKNEYKISSDDYPNEKNATNYFVKGSVNITNYEENFLKTERVNK